MNTQPQAGAPFQPGLSQDSQVVSFKDWMLTIFLLAIPVVNLVLLFVWAFGGNTSASKSNYAKAALVWMLIGIVLSVIFSGLLFGAMAAIFSTLE